MHAHTTHVHTHITHTHTQSHACTHTHTQSHACTHTITGASVVVILVHALIMDIPDQTADEELGIVMEDVTIS